MQPSPRWPALCANSDKYFLVVSVEHKRFQFAGADLLLIAFDSSGSVDQDSWILNPSHY